MEKIVKFAQRLENIFFEYIIGIRTRGYADPLEDGHYHYSTISYRTLFQIFKFIRPTTDDLLFDLGCGKGRALCSAALFPFKKVVGVEFNNELCQIAKINCENMRWRKSAYEIVHDLAQNIDYSSGNVFYLFNPFDAEILSDVLSKIQSTLVSNPRIIRLVYVNPKEELVLARTSWIQKYEEWKIGKVPGLEHDVSFWRTC